MRSRRLLFQSRVTTKMIGIGVADQSKINSGRVFSDGFQLWEQKHIRRFLDSGVHNHNPFIYEQVLIKCP